MKVEIEEKDIHIDARWFSPERDVSRSKGLHLSNVLDFIEYNEGKDRGGEMTPQGHAFAAAGFMWERVLAHLTERSPEELWEWIYGRVLAEPLNPKIIRPGEQELDGIWMTPDGFHCDDYCLEEWKYTFKSARFPITDKRFRRWVSFQIPAYLKVLNLDTCRLRVFFARGNHDGGPPVWRQYLLRYTRQEIDETWDCITANAAAMRKGGY